MSPSDEKNISSVIDILESHQRSVSDRKPLRSLSFEEFLQLVQVEPRYAENAHQCLYRILAGEPGVRTIALKDNEQLRRAFGLTEEDVLFIPCAFDGNFYGLELTLHELLVRYLKPANEFGEAFLQALALIGPVGGGKSSIVERIKFRLETETFFTIEGCPMWDNPLWALPRSRRAELSEALGVDINFAKDELAPDICPICRYKLHNEFDNDYRRLRVVEKRFSKRDRVGIATITPVEVENADTSVIIGSSDISQWDEFHEADPRAIKLDGAANRANRGVLEHLEGFELPQAFLNHVISSTQERRIDAPSRQGQVSVDFVPIIHSNEEKMEEFFSRPENLKFYDRIVVIYVPYNLRLTEELKLYMKLIQRSRFRTFSIDPHVLDLTALFAIMTRLLPSEQHPNLVDKVYVFNGQEVKVGTKVLTVNDLLNENLSGREGMSGLSPRFVAKAIDSAFSYNALQGFSCLTTLTVLKRFERALRDDVLISKDPDTLKRYLGYLRNEILTEYKARVARNLISAFVRVNEHQAESLFQKYLDEAERSVRRAQNINTEPPVLAVLNAIEAHLDKRDEGSLFAFRNSIVTYANDRRMHPELPPLKWSDYPKMKDIIEKILRSFMFQLLRVPKEDRLRNSEQKEMYQRWSDTLIRDFGYCESCAPITLDWASDNLS